MKPKHPAILVSLALLPLAFSCGGGAEAEAGSAPSVGVQFDGVSDTVVTFGDVDVVIDPSVPFSMRQITGSGSTHLFFSINADDLPELAAEERPGTHVFVAGGRMTVERGRLSIGDADYGAVAAESEVHVDEQGVHVDGELRGALPGA